MALFGESNVKRLQEEKDIEGLIKVLEYQKDNSVRWDIVEALGQLGDDRALHTLIVALKDESYLTRLLAARSLGQIKNVRAIDPLIVLLDDRDSSVRESAALALNQLGWQPVKPALAARFYIAIEEWEKVRGFGCDAIEPLIQALGTHTHKNARINAAKVLVLLYQDEKLNSKFKKQILGVRDTILRHTDRIESERISCFEYKDVHNDYGIGVDFPL